MSGYHEMASLVNEEESMIKYFRDKIIGRPALFCQSGDSTIEDDMPPIKNASSQNDLNDVVLISSTANGAVNQAEKLTAGHSALSSGRRPIPSSSPIVIPRKPPRSNASSQSSSSYTSIADQASSLADSIVPTEDVSNSALPTLPSTSQQLEHSAARDRISVKNKRRQPIKQKLSTLRETDDNEIDLFSSKTEDDDEIPPPLPPKQLHLRKPSVLLSIRTRKYTTTKAKMKKSDNSSLIFSTISSTPEEEQPSVIMTRVEVKKPQPLIDLSDLDTARARLRMSVRSRDRSADNILLATNINIDNETPSNTSPLVTTISNPVQRSVSFKRLQEIKDMKLINRPILKPKREIDENILSMCKPIENASTSVDHSVQNENVHEQNAINNSSPTKSISRASSQEHIYDNLDVFKRPKPNILIPPNDDESLTTNIVKTREHPIPATRLRPLTMHVTATNDKQTASEFENIFNQLKKRGSIRRVRPNEETMADEPNPTAPVDEIRAPPSPSIRTENEPAMPMNKISDEISSTPTPNRRKTVAGVHLSANNKVATNDNKPTPSWVDIAKQKQNKFHTVSNEKNHQDEPEQQLHPMSMESPVPIRKSTASVDVRSNRKSMFEQTTAQANAHALERDSIRALKAGNPNRINNLIQFFDK